MSRKSKKVYQAYRQVWSEMVQRDSLRSYLLGWKDATSHKPMDDLCSEPYSDGYKDGQKDYRRAEAKAAKKYGVKLLKITLQ